MARDRQRAKQRKQRSAADGPGRAADPAARADQQDSPSPGAPASPPEQERGADFAVAAASPAESGGAAAQAFGGEADQSSAASAFGEGGHGPQSTASTAAQAPGSPAHHGRPSLVVRAIAFLRASRAELQRMQWPDRQQTTQATAVVLGFVVVAGIYLGIADFVAQQIVKAIF